MVPLVAAADRLRSDTRAGDVRTETQEQAKRRVDDRLPALVHDAAAAVHIAAVDPGTRTSLTLALRTELPGVRATRLADCTLTDSTKVTQQTQLLFAFGDQLWCSRRVQKVVTATQEEELRRMKVAFADEPEIVRNLGPTSLPASLELTAADGVDPRKLATDLAKTLPDADRAEQVRCSAVPHPVVPG